MTGWTLKKDKELLGGNSEAIKLYSMHRTLVIWIIKAINYSSFFLVVRRLIVFLYFLVNFILCEKKLTGSRQYAWEQTKLMLSSHQRLNVEGPNINNEIHDHSKSINKSKYYEDKDNFHQWLVGFTDGDGSFSIIRVGGKWTLFFKIGQSSYNLRALYFIKKGLGVGSVHVEANSKADFRIRDRKVIGSVILPIFDKYPLLTSKHYDYLKFKKAYKILTDPNLSTKEKDSLLLELKSKKVRPDYISPAWEKLNYKVNDTHDAKLVMSKYWLVGFTEAEGSFYLVSKEPTRIVHAFEITQKLDIIVLKAIAHILGISTAHHPEGEEKKTYNTVVTTNSRSIANIIEYYSNTMKGMKAVEFKIWARSFVKHRGKFKELHKIRENIRVIRKIRLNKDCHLIND